MFQTLIKEWKSYLGKELLEKTESKLGDFIEHEYLSKTVYPAKENIFNALNLCPPKSVKVVILGQDPYHGEGEAHGLSFSVQEGTKCPPSLRNIQNELVADLGIKLATNGDLSHWARSGVLLLNTVLTVEKDKCHSHRNNGWEEFTGDIIEKLGQSDSPKVFMLWGAPANSFAKYIDTSKHLILSTSHPSPLSSYRGFIGSKHFSKANDWLISKGLKKVDW
jgi:uracil-DNA glycosylase